MTKIAYTSTIVCPCRNSILLRCQLVFDTLMPTTDRVDTVDRGRNTLHHVYASAKR